MFKTSRLIITMIIAVVILAGIILILYNSYTNSTVLEFQIKDGMIVTDESGNALRMTFFQENWLLILISTVVLIGGGLLAGIKLAKKQ